MSVPYFIGEDLGADKKNRWLGARITEGEYQYFLDLMSDWGVKDKSTALRGILRFTAEWMPKIAEQEGEPMSDALMASAELVTAMNEAARRETLKKHSLSAYAKALKIDHEPTKRRLLAAAKKHAEIFDLEWPPAGTDPLYADPDMQYVHTRIMSLISQSDESRVTLREVVVNTNGDKSSITPSIEKLEECGYIMVTEERRSGPPTLWITLPTMDLTAK